MGLSTWKALHYGHGLWSITPQGQKFEMVPLYIIGVKVVVYKFTQANGKKPLDNYIDSTKKRASRATALRADGVPVRVDF